MIPARIHSGTKPSVRYENWSEFTPAGVKLFRGIMETNTKPGTRMKLANVCLAVLFGFVSFHFCVSISFHANLKANHESSQEIVE